MAGAAEYNIAVDAVVANADYAEVGSATKAKALQTALTKLIVLTPAMAAIGRDGGQETRYDVEQLRQLKNEVEAWIGNNPDTAANAGAGTVTYADFSGYRE